MEVYSYLSYHLLAYFGWRVYHSVEDSEFIVMYGNDSIPIHVRRVLDEEKHVYSSVLIVS